jgi:hypothetical protein
MYVCTGCGMDVTETLPVIGNVVEVAIYDVHGEVPCKAVTVPDIGKVTDVDIYAFQGVVA